MRSFDFFFRFKIIFITFVEFFNRFRRNFLFYLLFKIKLASQFFLSQLQLLFIIGGGGYLVFFGSLVEDCAVNVNFNRFRIKLVKRNFLFQFGISIICLSNF